MALRIRLPTGISLLVTWKRRENAGSEIRGFAASSASESNDLPDGLMDVPQIADYPNVSKTSVYKLTERQEFPAIRIGRLLRVSKDELDEALRTIGNDIQALPI